jgi:hypothetical protein
MGEMNRRSSVLVHGLIAVIAISVAVAWMHPALSFRGQIYTSSDAEAAAAFQSLGDGSADQEFPHWNPFVFAGMPSYASLAHNPGTYPLTTPLRVVLDALGLPPMFWMLCHLGLAGLFTVGWVRWRGPSWVVAIAAGCWVVAIPKLAAWGAYGHGTKLGGFAWLPLVGWCAEAVLRRGGWGWMSGLAFAWAMMLLRGHVQIVYYAVMMVGIFVVAQVLASWKDPQARRSSLLRCGLVVLAGLLALGSSLSLYLPVLEYQAHSIRGAGSQGGGAAFEYATNWSLSFAEFASQWWPTVAGYGGGAYVGQMPFTDYPNYIGLPLLLLALLGAVVRRDRMSWALVGVVVLATALALGRNLFVYQVAFEILPGFRKFRVPVMILALQELAIILLAARGLMALSSPDGSTRVELARPVLFGLGGVGLLGMLVATVGAGPLRDSVVESLRSMAAGFGRPVPPTEALRAAADIAVGDALRIGAVLAASALVLFAAGEGRIPRPAAATLIAVLVFFDLWRVDQPLLRPEDHLPQLARSDRGMVVVPSRTLLAPADALVDYARETELARWLKQQDPRPRVLPLGGFEADNRLAAQHVVSLGGYHAAKLKVYEEVRRKLFDPQRPRLGLARMFGVRWVVSPSPLSEATLEAIAALGLPLESTQPAFADESGVAYAIADPLPRAWAVRQVSLETPGEDTTDEEPAPSVLERVLAADFDPGREAILSARPDPMPAATGQPADVQVLEEGYNHWSLQVGLDQPGVLVTPDVWYPEWSVRVDGEKRPILRADYALRAVALTAGDHRVEFRYEARSYRRGKTVAWISAAGIFAGWALPPVFWRRRRSQQEQA